MEDKTIKWARAPSSLDRAPMTRVSGSPPLLPEQRAARCLSEHTGAVHALCFWSSAEKGNILVSGGEDGLVKIWSLDKDDTLHTLHGHSGTVRCLAVSKHGHHNPFVISGGDDAKLLLWSLSSGKLLHTLKGHHGSILAIVMCEDDRFPFVASAGLDKAVRLWNFISGEFMYMLQGHDQAVMGLAMTARSPPLLVSAGADKMMKVWEISSGRLVRKLEGHLGRITCVAISKDPSSNAILVSADSTGAVIVWDLKMYKRLFNLIVPSDNPIVTTNEVSENDIFCEGIYTQSAGEITSVALSSSCENMVIITCSWGVGVKVWDAKSGGLLRVFDDAFFKSMQRVLICCDAVSPLLAMASGEGSINLLSPEDDYHEACRSITSLRKMSIESSLALVGKYIAYVRLADDASEMHAGFINKRHSDSSNVLLAIVFYCMIRFAAVNPSFFLANVDITIAVLSKIVDLVDLLFVDSFVGITAMQFLLERRVCISLAQDWIRIEKNQNRVMAFLADKLQSSDTLDCVLSALVTDNAEGWNVLVSHANFPAIFENLMLHCPRSHSKLSFLIKKYGLYVESEPFHIPLKVPADREVTAMRLDKIEYNTRGVHCYRVRMQDRLQSEFYMTHKFLEALVCSESVEELVETPLISYVLQYRWDTFGYNATVGLGILHLFYCINAMSAVFCICSKEYEVCRLHPTHAVSVTIVVVINTLYMGLAALQFKMTPDVWSFVTNFWSVTEILMIASCHVCMILGTALGPIFAIRQISAVFSLLLWAWLPYFGRGSFGLASLLHQMRIIIWEVRYFVGILLLFNCAFAVAFRILDIYDSVWYASIRCFNMMVGDVHFDFVFGHTFAEILYVIFLICVGIILLNSLIAFMEGSLGSARKKEESASIISQAQFLVELEVRLLPFNRLVSFFSSSPEETLQEHLSPSAVITKDGGRGNVVHAKKGARAGIQNELIFLFPESFGMPPFPVKDGIVAASDAQKADTQTDRKRMTTKGTSADSPSAITIAESCVRRLEQVELQVSSLDKKLDLIINLLAKGSSPGMLPPTRSASVAQGIDIDSYFSVFHSSSDNFSTQLHVAHPPPGGGITASIPKLSIPPTVGESALTPMSANSADELISYSYFGGPDEADNDTEQV